MVNIAGLDKAEVLAALHAASHAQGMSFLHDKGPLSVEECRAYTSEGQLNFDYLRGRVLKVNLRGDEFDPRLFDCDNYTGAAENAIAALRAKVAA